MSPTRQIDTTDGIWTVESRRSVDIPLANLVVEGQLEMYPEVESKGYFSVQFRGRTLQLTAGPYIGLIPINSRVTIEVLPKLPVSNLARIIEAAQQPITSLRPFHRLYDTQPEATVSIVEFFALNLLSALQEVEIHGLYKIYIPHTENSSHPRGRIDFRRTALLNFSRGIRHKVYTTFYQQTVDAPYNRILKYALWFLVQRLSRTQNRNRELIYNLNEALAYFESVSLDCSQQLIAQVYHDLRQQRIPSVRRYYEKALTIALTVVAGKGVSLVDRGQEVELSSYVVNFEDLFEAYLRQVLRARIQNVRSDVRVRDGNKEAKKPLFDDTKKRYAEPDIIIDNPPNRSTIVIEVKYKDKVDRVDINQAITYGCSYRASNIVLVHQGTAGNPIGKQRLGSIGGMNVFTYAFNLGNPSLETEEQAFADSLMALIAPTY